MTEPVPPRPIDERKQLPQLLAEAAASMPWPTRGRDITWQMADHRVDFDFQSEGVGIKHPFYESGYWTLREGFSARKCVTKGSWSDHPSWEFGTLAQRVAKAADAHRQLLEEEIAAGNVDA